MHSFTTGFLIYHMLKQSLKYTVIAYIALKIVQVTNSSHVVKHLHVQNKQSPDRSINFNNPAINSREVLTIHSLTNTL